MGKRTILPGESTAPHDVTYVALGTGLLWFGWFGFNGGSALAANGVAAIAVANTFIAGATAMGLASVAAGRHRRVDHHSGGTGGGAGTQRLAGAEHLGLYGTVGQSMGSDLPSFHGAVVYAGRSGHHTVRLAGLFDRRREAAAI